VNWLDKIIAEVSPGAGLQRARQRLALDAVRQYDAVRPGNRRIENWRRVDGGPRGEAELGAARLRVLVRDLLRNNGYARKAHGKLVSSTVGTGITGSVVTLADGKPANRRLRDAWARLVDEADWLGEQDLNGLMLTAARALFSDGDVIIRRYFTPFDANTRTPPVRFQVLEIDHLDQGKSSLHADANGRFIDRGIEYDADGRKVALWLYPDHPANISRSIRANWESVRVPVGEAIQLYDILRPGQDRGVSIFSAAIMPLNELANYLDREAMRKTIEACLAGFISSPEPAAMGGLQVGASTGTDANGNATLEFVPGMIHRMKPGESFQSGPVAPVGDMGPFVRQMGFLAAAGVNVMFEHMTGDMSGVNYSSYRVGSFDFGQFAEQLQWQVLVPRMCKRMFGAGFLEASLALGLPGAGNAGLRWTPPRPITSPDPEKDARAAKLEVDMFSRSLSELAEERGWTLPELVERIKSDRELIQTELGIDALTINKLLFPATPASPAAAPQEGNTNA
jgi:lambda family phage portal protein